jgi:hypothetical protein
LQLRPGPGYYFTAMSEKGLREELPLELSDGVVIPEWRLA